MSLKSVNLPQRYNYVACFLTLNCNLKCDYCINWLGNADDSKRAAVSGKQWVEALNRLVCRDDLPITLQGGEPSLHPDFIWIINNLRKDTHIDILTNLTFNIDKFISSVDPNRIKRKAPYPSIRVSYHPNFMDLDRLIEKTLKMQKAGFSIGIFSVLHPKSKEHILKVQKQCQDLGIDFRTKEFLGWFEGKLYGTYRYPGAIGSDERKKCLCRNSELIVGPDCNIFRCHHDIYKNFPPIGNLLDRDFTVKDIFRKCDQFGDCNPCDMKTKTNRFQIFGHTSAEVKIEESV